MRFCKNFRSIPLKNMWDTVENFIRGQVSGGFLLIFFTIAALAWANSSFSEAYHSFSKILGPGINDGLMSFFLLLVGLEIKRELCVGELNSFRKAFLPVVAALCGMGIPALIFLLINLHHPENYPGWAIPTATDIAFALGVLGLFKKRIHKNIFILLAAIAIADDMGAVMIISVFYTKNLDFYNLLYSALCFTFLLCLNFLKVRQLSIYLFVGVFLWLFLLRSGVHPSIAGVLLAFTIPLLSDKNALSPLQRLENALNFFVNYGVVPLFILFNAGISFRDLAISSSTEGLFSIIKDPLLLGIILGLVLGKPLGIGLSAMMLVKLRWASLPRGISFKEILFMAFLAGIGFTMAIFISDLAFTSEAMKNLAKTGILMGSIGSIFTGILSLLFWRK